MVCFQLMLSVIICWGLSVNRVEAAGSAGNTPASIIIRARAEITEQRIYVRDILSACTDNILKHRIEKLLLGPAPPPGREKILKGPWIESRIRSQSWMPKTAVISVPEKVRVVRAHQRLSHKRLKQLFCDYVASVSTVGSFKIRRFKVRGTDSFPRGRVTLSILRPSNERVAGRVSVPVKVFVDGNPSGKIFLSGWVDRYVNVVCAGRFLPRNTILGAGDLRWVRINISKAPKNLITDVEQAIGKRLKQSLKEGQPLRSNMIAVPPVIKRGDRVKIVAQRGGLKVETVGIAKGSGALGEQIKVMNITSRKTVVGRIKDASTVRVLF